MQTKTRRLALVTAALIAPHATAQTISDPLNPPPNGPRHTDPTAHILANATIHIAPGEVIERGQVNFKDGRITWIGSLSGTTIAMEGYRVWDCEGLHIYPGFIDAFVEVDVPKPDQSDPGAHWSNVVMPQRNVLSAGGLKESDAKALRKLGFTAAALSPEDGIFRGQGAVVSLRQPASDDSSAMSPVYASSVFQTIGIDSAGWRGSYPTSKIGAIALIRQTLIDAQWQADAREAGEQIAPNCVDTLTGATLAFECDDELEGLWSRRIISEFDRDALLIGSGMEFRMLAAYEQLNAESQVSMVVPLRFPEKPDVSSIGAIEDIDLRDLMTWEQAPTNPRRLDDAGIKIALTSSKIEKRGDFTKNLHRAIEHGLSEDRALAMLTTHPAEILGLDDRLGTLNQGMVANIIVADGPIFDDDTEIRDVWIDGRRHEINAPEGLKPDGRWQVSFGDQQGPVIEIKDKKVTLSSDNEEGEIKARNVSINENRLSYVIDNPDDDYEGVIVVRAIIEGDEMLGKLMMADGGSMPWTATRLEDEESAEESAEDDADETESPDVPEEYGYPFGPYASPTPPQSQTVVFTNATIWTSGPQGVLENGWLVIEDGKIVAVGNGPLDVMTREAGETIDLEGMHITPGLIDAHSHTALWAGGVNEGGQAVTAEVRIQDCMDPASINWYRQLAGGVTTVNSLHGSANPIGGQNQIHKVRWGALHPDDMRMENAKLGIKFALGENVKQSNWGDDYTSRYPQTRMGVETLIRDRFTAAREYMEAVDTDSPPRRDLELEALAQILAGDRLVHCHSYRQDEILMLCRVAEDFGFKIGTFQHGLECYKVAEAVREHSIGASIFSDWWAYKVEVQDAIPYAGPILHEAGVLVSFNSDSDELARRMNDEAAKAIKYGHLTEEEALKFVTINPAIQLAIDSRVGSIEQGKDADLAIWSGPPLASTSRCEATWIDGAEYFSTEKDAAYRAANAAERARIINKLLASKDKDEDDDGDKEGDDENADDRDPGVDSPPSLDQIRDLEARGINALGECGQCELDHEHIIELLKRN